MRPPHNSIARIATAAAAALALACCSGCLYVPTSSSAPPLQGREVRDADTAFLQPGVTTKDETVQRLGNPTMFWRDENVLIYRWVKRQGVMFWAIGGPYSAAVGATDIPQEIALLLKFDTADRYLASDTLERPPLKWFGDFLIDWRDAQRTRESASKEEAP